MPHELAHLPTTLWRLALPARQRQRLKRQVLEDLILQLCTQHWLSSRELGRLLDRQPDKLQTRALTAMVNAGRLVMRYPAVANRPDQAYRAKATGV